MAEVALAVVLVVGAGLMLRTVMNLMSVDAGFDQSRLVTFALELPPARIRKLEDQLQLYRRLFAQLETIPGVLRVTGMTGLPPNRQVDANDTDIGNYTAPKQGPFENVDYYQRVTQGYFETMGIPIVEGRGFEPTDAVGAPVAIVNETLVRTFWKDQNPIGQQIRQCCGDQNSLAHRRRRRQGRQAGRRRSEDGDRAVLPARSVSSPVSGHRRREAAR